MGFCISGQTLAFKQMYWFGVWHILFQWSFCCHIPSCTFYCHRARSNASPGWCCLLNLIQYVPLYLDQWPTFSKRVGECPPIFSKFYFFSLTSVRTSSEAVEKDKGK